MILLSPEQKAIVERLLAEHVPSVEVRAFGSRINGTAKNTSDLDLVIVGSEKLPWEILNRLQEAFEESRLAFRVDLMDWQRLDDSFREIIEKNSIIIQTAGSSNTYPHLE